MRLILEKAKLLIIILLVLPNVIFPKEMWIYFPLFPSILVGPKRADVVMLEHTTQYLSTMEQI